MSQGRQETWEFLEVQEAWEYLEEVLECREHQEVLEVSNIQEPSALDVGTNTLGQIWMIT